ncbi:MAG: porphobilinogen synthase [Candidatus Riflebacteria bacterium]|nr:porphobilinogen synthase [Candidatus Riflebacteria bacterium]
MFFPIKRQRRLRKDERFRTTFRETQLLRRNLVYPIFIEEGISEPSAINAMPGQMRWPVEKVSEAVGEAVNNGVSSFLLFGIPENKDKFGTSAYDPDGVIPQAVSMLRHRFPKALIITDVCLCAYTDHGHCGIPDASGKIQNDETLTYLCQMAVAHAKAGADIIAPSDMMDGRIAAIRSALDIDGYGDVPIMSYSVKSASSFYGPFREAADSAPKFGDRRSYQMDFANAREAFIELNLDYEEGADILMVKPALPSLDLIRMARDAFQCPIAAYQVSGEYSMIKAAAANGWIDEKSVILETLTSIKRAGADLIMSYFAPQAATWL